MIGRRIEILGLLRKIRIILGKIWWTLVILGDSWGMGMLLGTIGRDLFGSMDAFWIFMILTTLVLGIWGIYEIWWRNALGPLLEED